MADTVVPRKVRPEASKVMVAHTGRPQFSFAARMPARSSCRSLMVSKTIRSAPAAAPAVTISRKIS